MATSARTGVPLRHGQKPVLPPPIPSQLRRSDQPIDRPLGHRYASTAIAVMATLDIEAVYRYLRDDLPPSIRSAVTALGDPEWTTVYRQAIRMQSRLFEEARGRYRDLRHDGPLLLADFLPTTRA